MSSSHVLYGVAMQEAIKSGVFADLQQVRDAAVQHLADAAEIARLLPEVEKALAAQGAVPRPLYAVTIQDALARGDQTELARIKSEIAAYSQMISNPESGAVSVTPYGLAIQQAKDRGDQAEVERLTRVAEGLLAQLNAGKS
ncbi:DUF1843 domain-containing protein [Lysobacter hankyongensis]|uniref:DUF1843 domain-containing protein n=1 Tax=Lysobacter hankyongensis TaxID=1176535 RepID=A0ABP9BYY9_9GAMM